MVNQSVYAGTNRFLFGGQVSSKFEPEIAFKFSNSFYCLFILSLCSDNIRNKLPKTDVTALASHK
jgi:hypothetical protein